LPVKQRAAVLAHELQHAREIAQEKTVTDNLTLSNLFRRVGYERSTDPSTFETAAAVRAGLDVYQELCAAASTRR
jgi:hypothetical protein